MLTEREKMIAGEMYDPLDPELIVARTRARDLCQDLNATRDAEEANRRRILRERVFFNFNCIVLDVCPVRIGDFTLFGPAVQLYTPLHPFDAEQRRREEFGKPIEIGSDVWVGGGAIVLAGVRIGSRAVIGAGSVVTRDIPDGMFAAGNPCRIIRPVAGSMDRANA
jgi:maltose O-acetyltransferase